MEILAALPAVTAPELADSAIARAPIPTSVPALRRDAPTVVFPRFSRPDLSPVRGRPAMENPVARPAATGPPLAGGAIGRVPGSASAPTLRLATGRSRTDGRPDFLRPVPAAAAR